MNRRDFLKICFTGAAASLLDGCVGTGAVQPNTTQPHTGCDANGRRFFSPTVHYSGSPTYGDMIHEQAHVEFLEFISGKVRCEINGNMIVVEEAFAHARQITKGNDFEGARQSLLTGYSEQNQTYKMLVHQYLGGIGFVQTAIREQLLDALRESYERSAHEFILPHTHLQFQNLPQI